MYYNYINNDIINFKNNMQIQSNIFIRSLCVTRILKHINLRNFSGLFRVFIEVVFISYHKKHQYIFTITSKIIR